MWDFVRYNTNLKRYEIIYRQRMGFEKIPPVVLTDDRDFYNRIVKCIIPKQKDTNVGYLRTEKPGECLDFSRGR